MGIVGLTRYDAKGGVGPENKKYTQGFQPPAIHTIMILCGQGHAYQAGEEKVFRTRLAVARPLPGRDK